MADPPTSSHEGLQRSLGLLDITCIVIGAIVGVGIFFAPSEVAQLAGDAELTMWTWVIGGAIALMGAMTFAELGGLYTGRASQYCILRDAYGSLPAFLFVFCNATAIQAGAMAIIALICTNYACVAVDSDPSMAVRLIMASVLIITLTAINGAGVRLGASVQNATVYARLLTLAAVVMVALFADDASASPSVVTVTRPTGLAALCAALVPAFFSFGGWQHALWISGEVRNPQRNLPRAILVGVIVVAATYILVNWAYLRLLGYDGVRSSSALAAEAVGSAFAGSWPAQVLSVAVCVSAFGVLNAQLLSGPRLIHGMAEDGRFFAVFSKVHPRTQTPLPAILLLGGMSMVLLWCGGWDDHVLGRILTGVVFIDGVFFAMTGAAVFILRRKKAHVNRPVRVPGYPVVPALFVIGELGVVAGAYANPDARAAVFIGVAWIIGAGICYMVFHNKPAA